MGEVVDLEGCCLVGFFSSPVGHLVLSANPDLPHQSLRPKLTPSPPKSSIHFDQETDLDLDSTQAFVPLPGARLV
jgi:hypothetical protein